MSQLVNTKASLWNRFKATLKEAKQTFREGGLRGVIKRYGWKFFAVFFCYYLIRDLFLYVFLPLVIAKGLFGNG